MLTTALTFLLEFTSQFDLLGLVSNGNNSVDYSTSIHISLSLVATVTTALTFLGEVR